MNPSARGGADRLAVVVGGARGIGLATAEALHAQGRRVVVTSRGEALPGPFAHVRCDVRSPTDVRAAFRKIAGDHGEPDIAVVSAGIRHDRPLALMTDENFQEVIGTNLVGGWSIARAVLPGMMSRGWGRLTFVSSVAAVTGERGQVNYAASKAALLGLTQALARQVSARGVTVNAVLPGLVDTDMTADLTENARRRILSRVPCGRPGLASEIGETIAFLCGETAGAMTGAVIPVDGGLSMGH